MNNLRFKKKILRSAILILLLMLVVAPSYGQTLIKDWGDIGGRLIDSGWTINNDSTTKDGEVYLGGSESPNVYWTSIRGAFDDTLKATLDSTLVVRGTLSINGALTEWNPLRFGIFNHTDSGTLNHQYTDSAQWGYAQYEGTDSAGIFSNEESAFGYLITNQVGDNGTISGQGGVGNAWAVNGGSWISTWSAGTIQIGDAELSPRRAIMQAGNYTFEISAQPLRDGTTEFRWVLIDEEGEMYLQRGIHQDTTAQKTDFNGFLFALQAGTEAGVTEISLKNVRYGLEEPIEWPICICPSEFYLGEWGFVPGEFGGHDASDSSWTLTPGSLIGDVLIEGEAADGWASIAGDIGFPASITREEGLLLSAKIIFEGGGFEDPGSFKVGFFKSDEDLSLDSTKAIGYVWNDVSAILSGYLISPNDSSTTINAVTDSIWHIGTYPLSNRKAEGTPLAGEYELIFGVYGDEEVGITIKTKLEGEGYLFEAYARDESATEVSFDRFYFGINNSTTTGLIIEEAFVKWILPEEIQVSTEENTEALPDRFSLNQNYPNPFNPTTTISFNLPKASAVNLKVYDLLGREVAELLDGRLNAGEHSISFDASAFSSGMYIYRIKAGGFTSTKRMLLIK